MRDRYEALFAGVLEEGIASGETRPVNVAIVVKAVLGALNSIALWSVPREGETDAMRKRIAGDVATFAVEGLRPRS